MARYDFLSLIQRVLNRIDDENVNDVDETIEAEQVGMFINEVIDEIASDYPWYHLRSKGNLEVTATANVMKIPDSVTDILWVRYNDDDITYMEPAAFDEMITARDTSLSTVDSNGAFNDRDPSFWTTFDEENITFDAYDSDEGSTLISNNSACGFVTVPSDLDSATDEPDFPDRFHPIILDGATALAFYTIKRDPQMGLLFDRKYRMGMAKLKRLAQKASPTKSTYGVDYGRRGASSLINSRRVVESS